MQITKPSKEAVRHWMNRDRTKQPIYPTIEEVRRQLGWVLIEGARNGKSY
jgi:RecJ-like exonuclease